jgi:hypothetical protein
VLPALTQERVGIGPTRNRSLPHMLDGWVITVDSDDYIKVDATVRQLKLTDEASVRWSAALANDINAENQEIYVGPNFYAPGPLKAGAFLAHTLSHDLPPWRCSAMVIDAALILAAGGWANDLSLARIEDTTMVARITSAFGGLWVPEVVQVYRRHPHQTIADPAWLELPRRLDLLEEYAADREWLSKVGAMER